MDADDRGLGPGSLVGGSRSLGIIGDDRGNRVGWTEDVEGFVILWSVDADQWFS